MTASSTIPGGGKNPSDAAELARQHGLRRVGARPSMRAYVAELWSRRHFAWALASAKAYSRNQNNHLGQLWAVITPILLAATYYLIFGLLLDTTKGTENYVGFLVIGIFVFTFVAGVITAGAGAISGHLAMVRALHFPRALLPIAVAISQFLTFLPSLGVMTVIVLLTNESPQVKWLLLPVAALLLLVFGIGCSFIAARIVVAVRDLRNLIPLTTRLLRYLSGVFFSIAATVDRLRDFGTLGEIGAFVMEYQPVAIMLEVVRSALLAESTPTLKTWGVATGWALVTLLMGFVIFWKAEDRYGRD